jgi:hypothetical protein
MSGDVSWPWLTGALVVEATVIVLALLYRAWIVRRSIVHAGLPTTELGPESPAVVSLLTHRLTLSHLAAPATVIDLAVRRFIDIDEVASTLSLLRLQEGAGELRDYEAMILSALSEREVDGVVPAEACNLGPEDLSRSWWRSFEAKVRADAVEAGLARSPVTSTAWGLVVCVALLLPPVLVGIGTGLDLEVALGDMPVTLVTWSVLVPGLVVYALVQGRLIPTALGRAVAQQWLGVRAALAAADFSDRGPAAVIVWGPNLAYATAMGLAGATATAMPFGAEDARHAWASSYQHWRQIRISYPVWRPGWGHKPGRVLAWATVATAGGAVLSALLGRADNSIDAVLAVLSAAAAVAAGAVAIAATIDLRRCHSLDGEIIRLRQRPSDLDGVLPIIVHRPRWFLALDDGHATKIRAWSIPERDYQHLHLRQHLRVTVTPCLGYIRSYQPSNEPPT